MSVDDGARRSGDVDVELQLIGIVWFIRSCLQVPTDGGGGGSGAGADGSAPAQCPVCAQKPASQQLANALRSQLESRTQHDQFHDLLQRDPDPFGVVADYFRRGMFGGCGGDASDELPAMDARGAGLKVVFYRGRQM